MPVTTLERTPELGAEGEPQVEQVLGQRLSSTTQRLPALQCQAAGTGTRVCYPTVPTHSTASKGNTRAFLHFLQAELLGHKLSSLTQASGLTNASAGKVYWFVS